MAKIGKTFCSGCDLLGAEGLDMNSIFVVVVCFVQLHCLGNVGKKDILGLNPQNMSEKLNKKRLLFFLDILNVWL